MENPLYTSPLGTTAYRHLVGKANASVFYMAGHRNILDHHKGNLIEEYCRHEEISMTRFAHFGWDGSHSPAVPQGGEGYTAEWLMQALDVFDNLTTGPQILAGYSMGGYLQLALAMARPRRVAGIIGIAAGFGMGLCDKIKTRYGAYSVRTTDDQTGFDFAVESDNSVKISGTLPIECPVRLQHAISDDIVSYKNVFHLSASLASSDVTIRLTKNGLHRLNEPEDEAWLQHHIKALSS